MGCIPSKSLAFAGLNPRFKCRSVFLDKYGQIITHGEGRGQHMFVRESSSVRPPGVSGQTGCLGSPLFSVESGLAQAPSSNLQASENIQAPSFNPVLRPPAGGSAQSQSVGRCRHRWELAVWSFSEAWRLELGAWCLVLPCQPDNPDHPLPGIPGATENRGEPTIYP